MQAEVSVNFGPTYIVKPITPLFMNAVSELSPMGPEDRQLHELRIAQIKTTLNFTASSSSSSSSSNNIAALGANSSSNGNIALLALPHTTSSSSLP